MGVLQVSKWQDFHVQLDEDGVKKLFSDLDVSYGYRVGQIVQDDACVYSVEEYLSVYDEFLKAENIAPYRKSLSMGLSVSDDAFYAKVVSGGVIVTPKMPYIQIRASSYSISKDGKILPGVLGADVHKWGLHFAYPLLAMNSKEGIAKNVLTQPEFSNTKLFKVLQKWIREWTKPADIAVNEQVVRTTMRCMR